MYMAKARFLKLVTPADRTVLNRGGKAAATVNRKHAVLRDSDDGDDDLLAGGSVH